MKMRNVMLGVVLLLVGFSLVSCDNPARGDNNNVTVNTDPRTVVITGIPMALMAEAAGGILGVFPGTPTEAQVRNDFATLILGGGTIQHMRAGHILDGTDETEIDTATGTLTTTVPLLAVQGITLGSAWTETGTFSIVIGIIVRDSIVLYSHPPRHIATATTSAPMSAAVAATVEGFFPSLSGTIDLTGITIPDSTTVIWLNVRDAFGADAVTPLWRNHSVGENFVDWTKEPSAPWAIHRRHIHFLSGANDESPVHSLRFTLRIDYTASSGEEIRLEPAAFLLVTLDAPKTLRELLDYDFELSGFVPVSNMP